MEFLNDEVLTCIADQTEGMTGRALFKMLNALSGNKSASDNNKLTAKMVDNVVRHFVEQEKEVLVSCDPNRNN